MLDKIMFLEDAEDLAHKILPREIWNYLMAYTERGLSYKNNLLAYER